MIRLSYGRYVCSACVSILSKRKMALHAGASEDLLGSHLHTMFMYVS